MNRSTTIAERARHTAEILWSGEAMPEQQAKLHADYKVFEAYHGYILSKMLAAARDEVGLEDDDIPGTDTDTGTDTLVADGDDDADLPDDWQDVAKEMVREAVRW